MADSVIPSGVSIPHAAYLVGPTSDRYALAPNADGSINIVGSITASNPSVGTTGDTAPASATEVGWIDGSGDLVGVSAANPLPVSASVSIGESVLNVVGTASSAAVLSNFPINPTTGYRTAAVQITGITAGNTVIAEESNDGSTWYGIQTVDDTVAQSATPMTAVGLYFFPLSGLAFRLRISVYVSGSADANTEFRQNVPAVGVVGVLSDSTTIAGSAPGTAGVPSANVVSIQGVSGGAAIADVPDTAGFISGTNSATTTGSTEVIAAVLGKSLYITGYSLSNSSASSTVVSFQDGNGGATLWIAEVPAGGGNNMSSNRPLFKTTSGNALYFASDTAVTTAFANAAGFSQ